LAKEQGWSPEQAYEKLYGEEERQTKDKEREEAAALEKQKQTEQETPSGEKQKVQEEWEKALSGLGQRDVVIEKAFKKAGL
jgi:hypothetical protein